MLSNVVRRATINLARSPLSKPLNFRQYQTLNSAIHDGLRADQRVRRNERRAPLKTRSDRDLDEDWRYSDSKSSRTPSRTRRNRHSDEDWGDSDPRTSILRHNASSEFLFGRNSVLAALRAKRRIFYNLYHLAPSKDRYAEAEESPHDDAVQVAANEANVKTQIVPRSWLPAFNRISGSAPHNSYILEASRRPFPIIKHLQAAVGSVTEDPSDERFFTVQKLLSVKSIKPDAPTKVTFKSQSQRPVIVLLTGILDPQNLGAILRSAYYFGVAAVVLPLRKRADPDAPATIKAASGASEGVNILQCEHALDFVQASRAKGWYVMGAMPPPPEQPQENVEEQFGRRGKKVKYHVNDKPRLTIPTMSSVLTHLEKPSQPILLVLGGEQEGISYDFCRFMNAYVTIKRNNVDELGVDSLNVSVAAGLIFAEVTKDLPITS